MLWGRSTGRVREAWAVLGKARDLLPRWICVASESRNPIITGLRTRSAYTTNGCMPLNVVIFS
jgi:hypothetical protein